MRVILLLLLMVLLGPARANTNVPGQEAVVVAPIGKIRGNFMDSRLGRQFFSVRGVRYAEPPVGKNRFKQAIPARSWTTVFDATQEGPSCPQPGRIASSEDCLRLNVYSPELPSPQKPDVKIPVLVFFHPGALYEGSTQSIIFGPEYLMDQDIVLATVNYRLEALGFISTGDRYAPGNLGFKDQVEALRWIRKNIKAFGGNARNLTIVGYSAGGWSISLHMVSPMSKGLFHRAIVMSGSLTIQQHFGRHQLHLAKKQAELLECPTNTTKNMITCLRAKPVQNFSDSLFKMFEWNKNPILLWTPVIEPKVPGVERFLTAQPEDLIRQGKFHKVPLITGITKDELGGHTVSWVEAARRKNNSVFDDLNNNWEDLAPVLFLYERGTLRSKQISRALRSFYFKDQPISVNTDNSLAQIYSDGVIGFSVHRLAKLISEMSWQPVYYYEFTYQGRYSHTVWPETKKPYGVVHLDDLLYLFCSKKYCPYIKVVDPEYQTVKRMISMWTSFVKTGNPIPNDDKTFKNVKWEAFTPTNNKYLKIGKTLTMDTGLNAERMNEWEKLFPLHPKANYTCEN